MAHIKDRNLRVHTCLNIMRNIKTQLYCAQLMLWNALCRVHWCGEEAAGLGCTLRCHQEQEAPDMAEDPRTHHGEVPAAVCRPQEKSHSKGGTLPVQEHLSAGKLVQLPVVAGSLCTVDRTWDSIKRSDIWNVLLLFQMWIILVTRMWISQLQICINTALFYKSFCCLFYY